MDRVKVYCKNYPVFLIFCSVGCSIVEEIERKISPDGLVEAVVTRTNNHATTPFVMQIYIVPKGEEVSDERLIFKATHVKDLGVNWYQDKLLEISYKEAQIYHFTNFWSSREVRDFRYVVEARLAPENKLFSLSERGL